MAIQDSANLSLDRNSVSGSAKTVTIPAGTKIRGGSGTDGSGSVPCRSCLIKVGAASVGVYMQIGATAANTDWPLSTTAIPVPIDDLNKLYFLGTAADKVHILYRS